VSLSMAVIVLFDNSGREMRNMSRSLAALQLILLSGGGVNCCTRGLVVGSVLAGKYGLVL